MLPRAQTPVLYVTHNANDLRLHIEQTDVEVFSDGVLIRKIFARESSVNQGYGGSMLVIALRKRTAAFDRNAHSPVIVRIHQVKERKRHVVIVRGLGLAFKPERNFRISGHWQRTTHHGNRFHAANALKLPQGFTVHGAKLIRLSSRIGGRGDREGEDVMRIETRIDTA